MSMGVITEAVVYAGREFQKAVKLNGGSKERLGLGLVSFTGGWLLDSAIALQPAAIVGPPHSACTSATVCLLYKSKCIMYGFQTRLFRRYRAVACVWRL